MYPSAPFVSLGSETSKCGHEQRGSFTRAVLPAIKTYSYMNRFRLLLTSFFVCVLAGPAALAQQKLPIYTVKVGTFLNPKPEDFKPLRSLGFVYAVPLANKHTDLYLGGFFEEEAAETIVRQLQNPQYGFPNASVVRIETEGAPYQTLIQLATFGAGEEFKWEPFLAIGRIFVLLEGNYVKVLTGFFPDKKTAAGELDRIKKAGFKDAFVKEVNSALLHEVGDFELGTREAKQAIPLDLEAARKLYEEEEKQASKSAASQPSITAPAPGELVSKGVDTAPASLTPPPSLKTLDVSAELPQIRSNVKRSSALELQKALASAGFYQGKADGFYGPMTTTSLNRAFNQNIQLRKYRILARHFYTPEQNAPVGSLQFAINTLWEDPNQALSILQSSKEPLAKVYRAYFKYVMDGPSDEINKLMNSAIREAFANVRTTIPQFDPAATYAYADLEQLLLHLRYIQQYGTNQYEAPCWLFSKHPGPALAAFSRGNTDGLKLQDCGGFWDWESIQILHAIATDIGAQDHASRHSPTLLAVYFLDPKAPSTEETKALETWNSTLWRNIDAWASRDPMFKQMTNALKIAFFHSQVLLEDYFMNYGMKAEQARATALAVLKEIVGHDLERFL